jgi:dynein heavy chain, axonemal
VLIAVQVAAQYKRLWVHEVFRVFYDRLVDDKDRQWLLKQVKATVKGVLREDFNTLMAGILESPEAEVVTSDDMRRCFFGDYLDTDSEAADRNYAEVR